MQIKYFLLLLVSLLSTTAVANADFERQAFDDTLKEVLKKSVNKQQGFYDKYEAEVWLLATSEKLSRFIKDPNKRFPLLRQIHEAATKEQLEPELVLAVIQIESYFDHFAISHAGAQGLMQVMPFWKNEIGRPDDNLTDITTNLRYGCAILKHYLNRENGHIANALARYNGSYGSYKYSKKVMDAWLDYWR